VRASARTLLRSIRRLRLDLEREAGRALREKIEVGVAGQFGGAQTAAEIVAIFIEENDIRMT
jgi:hypothetical protein